MKKLIILAVILIIVGGIIFGISSFRPVNFATNDDVQSLVFIDEAGNDLRTVEVGATQWLTPGDYSVSPRGEKSSEFPIDFTIARGFGTVEIVVDPDYGYEYNLSIEPETTKIVTALLRQQYPSIMDDYELRNANLYGKADWYTAILVDTSSTAEEKRDPYRVIARNNAGTWQVVHRPVLVVSQKDFGGVPADIIESANQSVLGLY